MRYYLEDYLLKKYKNKISSTVGRVDKNGDPIEMRLTFEEWKDIWLASGKIPSIEYVLSRYNDIGHYEVGNVFVQHIKHNSCEGVNLVSDYDKKITDYSIKTGYKRIQIRKMIKAGKLVL